MGKQDSNNQNRNSRILLLPFFVLFALGAGAEENAKLQIDKERNEIRVAGVVQKTPGKAAHDRWGKKSTAFVGVKGGSETKDFIVVMDADRPAIYKAAKDELGWQTGRRYGFIRGKLRSGLNSRTKPEDYMTGDPVLCALEFTKNGEKHRIALEDVIRCRIEVDKKWVEKPFTPHFVFTGAGEENGIDSGCVYCPSDCVGALFTDNSVPVLTELHEYWVDWSKLPPPDSPVTVIMRSIR